MDGRELLRLQRAEGAEAALRASLATADDPATHYLLGLALLMQGRYLEGFAEYEHREVRRTTPARRLSFPEWDGAPLAGRSILVFTEQGLGDEIMLARFVPRLRELGASRIAVACQPAMVRVFQQLGVDEVVPRFLPGGGQVSIPRCDVWTLILSLPFHLGLTLDQIRGEPYLRAPAAGGEGLAIVERGRPENPVDAARSIHDGALRQAFPQATVLEPRGDVMTSLTQLAGLDLLITVDTAWAHMAGALGVPCWVLLPFQHLDWRWMRGRGDTPWYRSLRLFRQSRAGDWSDPIRQARSTLAASCSVSAVRTARAP